MYVSLRMFLYVCQNTHSHVRRTTSICHGENKKCPVDTVLSYRPLVYLRVEFNAIRFSKNLISILVCSKSWNLTYLYNIHFLECLVCSSDRPFGDTHIFCCDIYRSPPFGLYHTCLYLIKHLSAKRQEYIFRLCRQILRAVNLSDYIVVN